MLSIKLHDFCTQVGVSFPPNDTAAIADFLCYIADSSQRPKSQLQSAISAIACLYDACDSENLVYDSDLKHLVTALIKSSTKLGRCRTPILPVKPFHDLFLNLENNDELTIHKLRIKCLTLLAFSLMLRPSDLAPHGLLFNAETLLVEHMTFCTDQIVFNDNGSMVLKLHGIKNDLDRAGFEVNIPPASHSKLDPVKTLKDYIKRTDNIRPVHSKPVFLTLCRPYRAISSSTIANDLASAIKLAGLDGKGYSAKSFRPTGATISVEKGCNPDIV